MALKAVGHRCEGREAIMEGSSEAEDVVGEARALRGGDRAEVALHQGFPIET